MKGRAGTVQHNQPSEKHNKETKKKLPLWTDSDQQTWFQLLTEVQPSADPCQALSLVKGQHGA